MAVGNSMVGDTDAAKIEDSGGVGKNLLITAGATQGQVKICPADGIPVGVTEEAQSTQLGYVPYAKLPCVHKVVASAAVARLTGTSPTRLVSAGSGKVKTLPTSGGGTTFIVGYVHEDSAASGQDGDIITAFLLAEAIPYTIPGS